MENTIQIRQNSFEIYDDGGYYINQIRLFHAYFNTIPNIKSISNLDIAKVKIFISDKYNGQIAGVNYHQDFDKNLKLSSERDFFFIFQNELIINLFKNNFYVLFDLKHETLAEELLKNVLPFLIKTKRTKEISLIISTNSGLRTKSIDVKKPNLNIDLHYNNDFKNVHENVLKSLKKNKTKGLYLFHGLPGTGKSTYIKYLIHQQNKQVIFLSPKMAANLDNLAFTEFLLDNPNIILVIEDAEELIMSRDNNQNSQLSFLLNLTDGLIADSLGIQIIATFNTNIKNIDKALLRKGRLTAIYEFKELEFQKANILLNHLKIEDFETLKPMTLADIFNHKENNFDIKKEKIKIGF